jgi:hypothetical protein
LAAGVYQDTITVTAPGAAGSPAFVPVTLTVSPAGSTGGGPLPELSLKGLDGMIYRLDEEIVFSYPVKGVTFQWSFTATASLTPAVRNASGSTLSLQGRGSKGEGWSTSSPSATTQAPRFTPTSLGLGPGTYQLTVIASRLGSESRSATARISLTASDLAGVKVYPNPWRSDKHAAHPTITFAGLTVGTTIKLFTASAHEVKELHTDGPTIAWDLTNDAGDKVASGIYMYLITDRQGDKVRGKLAVIK